MMPTTSTMRLGAIVCGVLCGTAAAQTCPVGDLDIDGAVGVTDMLALLGDWGACPPVPCPADLDGDGTVGVIDFLSLLAHWGPTDILAGTFPQTWIFGGPGCGTDPTIQVHQYNADTWILRQSLCTNYEGPFITLLFGQDRVLMQDTGAGSIHLATAVYGVIDEWLARRGQASIQLIVSHSHAHSDHVAGDSQFQGQPDTTVIGLSVAAVSSFFGIASWPTQIVEYNLGGGRIVDVIPIPGHQTAHIALYDRQTGLLFTGDTLYPGRLYIFDFPQYVQSITRLLDFTLDKPVCHVLGTHIEMSNTPGDDFPIGSTYHPDEHSLPLGREHLQELLGGLIGMQADPHIEVHDEFIIWPF